MKTFDFSEYSYRPVTSARNGYPEPEIGVFIFTDTLEELLTIEKETGGIVSLAHWRDGWHYCNGLGCVIISDEKDLKEWFKVCLMDDYFSVYEDVEDYIEHELKQTIEDEAELLEAIAEAREEFEDYDFIAGGDGCEFGGFDADLKHSYDSHNYRIGLFFPNSDFSIDWDNNIIK